MSIYKNLVVCGTGHRPDKLNGYSDEAFNKLVEFAEISLKVFEPTKVISGMALGWDLALAKAALNLNIPLIAALPFTTQTERWPDKHKILHSDILKQATEQINVCSGVCEIWKFQRRNEYMVNNAELVLALWDGTSGGTANCVAYANKKCVKVHNLWQKFITFNEN